MILWLYESLLALHPADVREAFGAEMRGVFLDAREDARARGWWAYAEFCRKEAFGMLMGLIGDGGVGRYKTWIRLCAAAGLGWAGYMAWQQTQQPYLSWAVFHLAPPRVAETVAAREELKADDLHRVMERVLSRTEATSVINALNLYPGERRRQPMQEVVEKFRRDVRVSMTSLVAGGESEKGFQIRFSYENAALAQKTVQDLVGRIAAAMAAEQRVRALRTEQFLEETAAVAGREMEAAFKTGTGERGRLDAALAQRQYESLRNKLAEARIQRQLTERRQGPELMVLDPASLPVENLMYEHAPWSVAGAAVGGWLAGACFGFVTALIWSWRPGHRPAATH